jgi:hypothetical protein
MVKARRVDINSITDLIRPTTAQPEPEWKQYIQELDGLSPGEAVEFTPEGDESSRTIMMRAARAAHSLGLDIRNLKTGRGTVVTEVRGTNWQPKPKTPKREGGAPTNGRRTRRSRQSEE